MTESEFHRLAANRQIVDVRIDYPPDGQMPSSTIETHALLLWYEAANRAVESSRSGWRVLVINGQVVSPRLVEVGWLTVLGAGRAVPPVQLERVDAAVATSVGVMEALCLAIRDSVRLRMQYRKVGGVAPEWRDVTATGIKGGTLYADDHDRGGAVRGFKLDGILAIEAAGDRVPRWDGSMYAIPGEGSPF